MDKISSAKRSEVMKAIKSKNSKLELAVRKELSGTELTPRYNVQNLLGKPDIVFRKKKLVIFLDSCFWHGRRLHCRMPVSRRTYWKSKILRNKERDKRINKDYKKTDWTIMRFWEHNIKKNPAKIVAKIGKKLMVGYNQNR